ncbi:mechanosensitive ion channel [Candidatus Woesearchaeota archaeon]|nr:mechanosensitive ion channel [Candidatus Woesearchaeota archaeon]
MADVVNESIVVLNEVGGSVNPLLSRIVIAVLILLIGLIIGKLAGLLIRRALNEVRLDKHIKSAGVKLSLEKFLGNIASFIIYLIAIIMSLDQLGLTTAILVIIVSIIVIVIAVSFLLAVKDFFPNMFAGIRIRMRHLFTEGDNIQIREVKGRILSVGLLETKVKTAFNEEVIIPNSIFNKRQVIVKKKIVKKKK